MKQALSEEKMKLRSLWKGYGIAVVLRISSAGGE